MNSFDNLAYHVTFEVLNLLKPTRVSSRSKSFSSPWRQAKFVIDQQLLNQLKTTYSIKGRFCECQKIMNDLRLENLKRYLAAETSQRHFFVPIISTWRFMLGKRSIKIEIEPGKFSHYTKYYFSLRFVIDQFKE
jgi:hypothetical protein